MTIIPRFKISDESSQRGPCFVVREWTFTGPILGYQWEWVCWCRSRDEAEKFITSATRPDVRGSRHQ